METTFMAHSSPVPHEQNKPWSPERSPDRLHDDPRWCLAERIVSGPHFCRSALLSKFLLFVVAETIEGREEEISEHQIGVHVFDRRSGYSTVEDNIVRNYARQLRKRLADHFADVGSTETLRIDIPLGGYVPVFAPAAEMDCPAKPHPHPIPVRLQIRASPVPDASLASGRTWKPWVLAGSLFAVYSLAPIWGTWVFAAT